MYPSFTKSRTCGGLKKDPFFREIRNVGAPPPPLYLSAPPPPPAMCCLNYDDVKITVYIVQDISLLSMTTEVVPTHFYAKKTMYKSKIVTGAKNDSLLAVSSLFYYFKLHVNKKSKNKNKYKRL